MDDRIRRGREKVGPAGNNNDEYKNDKRYHNINNDNTNDDNSNNNNDNADNNDNDDNNDDNNDITLKYT